MQKLDLKGLLTLTNTWSALPVMSRLIKIQTRISLIRQKIRRNFFDAKLDKNLGNPRKYFKGQNGRYLPKMAEGKAMKWSLTEWKSQSRRGACKALWRAGALISETRQRLRQRPPCFAAPELPPVHFFLEICVPTRHYEAQRKKKDLKYECNGNAAE